MSDKLKEPPTSSRDSTMEAKNAVEVPLAGSEGKAGTPRKPSQFDWDVLKTWKGALKLAQLVAGIIILGLEHPRPKLPTYSTVDGLLFFITLYVTIATLVILVDALQKTHPVRNTFGPYHWFRVELYFTGLVAVGLHILGFLVLMSAVSYWWVPELNLAGSVIALVASALYFIDWWRLFSGRSAVVAETGSAPAVEQLVVETR
ncbi:uncharacterized protein LOC131687668 [Topomyia yanbarensis]|uniref:uncharacterized protein LOC131687668 n=1 Tax=Topomyia yanbarensis TaxID=2498891 RepID=UPI00273CE1E0|nr:uncharacterized protein LOC131687668 [Topomyia yanbarensis]